MSAETLHVVTATDENGLVREQEVWADEPEAFRRFDELRAIYGGEFACIASRKVLGRRAPASDAGTGRPDEADDVGLAVWSALAAKHRTDANLHAITDAVRNILAGAPEPRETQGEREPAESASLTHIVNVDLPCALTEALSHEQDPAVIARFVRANNALPEISAIVARASGKPEQPESEGERIEGEAPYEDATDEELVLAYGRAVVSYQRQHDGAVDWPGSKAIDRLRATRADLLRALSEGPKRKLIAAGRRIAEEVERARAESLQHSGQEPAK